MASLDSFDRLHWIWLIKRPCQVHVLQTRHQDRSFEWMITRSSLHRRHSYGPRSYIHALPACNAVICSGNEEKHT